MHVGRGAAGAGGGWAAVCPSQGSACFCGAGGALAETVGPEVCAFPSRGEGRCFSVQRPSGQLPETPGATACLALVTRDSLPEQWPQGTGLQLQRGSGPRPGRPAPSPALRVWCGCGKGRGLGASGPLILSVCWAGEPGQPCCGRMELCPGLCLPHVEGLGRVWCQACGPQRTWWCPRLSWVASHCEAPEGAPISSLHLRRGGANPPSPSRIPRGQAFLVPCPVLRSNGPRPP